MQRNICENTNKLIELKVQDNLFKDSISNQFQGQIFLIKRKFVINKLLALLKLFYLHLVVEMWKK